jgi:hypothetical protein
VALQVWDDDDGDGTVADTMVVESIGQSKLVGGVVFSKIFVPFHVFFRRAPNHPQNKPRTPQQNENNKDNNNNDDNNKNHPAAAATITMDLGAQISQLSPDQRQALMAQAQQEANQSIMQDMMKNMVKTCFDRCAGTSVRF